jgi:hypothetical protein
VRLGFILGVSLNSCASNCRGYKNALQKSTQSAFPSANLVPSLNLAVPSTIFAEKAASWAAFPYGVSVI